MKIAGLLIMRDENDILMEYLSHITQFVNNVYVLDGSDDEKGREICGLFPQVVWYRRDSDFIASDRPKKDGIRGFVWETIKQSEYDWVLILHPDEFWLESPVKVLATKMETNNVLAVRAIHGFIHSQQKNTWNFEPFAKSIFNRTQWGMQPGHVEERGFRFDRELYFDVDLHGKTVPTNATGVFESQLKLLQCTYRTPEQIQKRINRNLSNGWQPNDFIMAAFTQSMFLDTLRSVPEAREMYPDAKSFYDFDGVDKSYLGNKPKIQWHVTDCKTALLEPIHLLECLDNPELLKWARFVKANPQQCIDGFRHLSRGIFERINRRVAICFSGHVRNYTTCLENHMNWIRKLNADVFISTYETTGIHSSFWNGSINETSSRFNTDEMLKIYKPKKYIIHTESFIDKTRAFPRSLHHVYIDPVKSMFDGIRETFEMTIEEGNYDVIIRMRFDVKLETLPEHNDLYFSFQPAANNEHVCDVAFVGPHRYANNFKNLNSQFIDKNADRIQNAEHALEIFLQESGIPYQKSGIKFNLQRNSNT